MDVPDLDPFFEPRSVAVVGASPDSWYSSQPAESLLTYGLEGELSLVNPGRERARDRPCHDRLANGPRSHERSSDGGTGRSLGGGRPRCSGRARDHHRVRRGRRREDETRRRTGHRYRGGGDPGLWAELHRAGQQSLRNRTHECLFAQTGVRVDRARQLRGRYEPLGFDPVMVRAEGVTIVDALARTVRATVAVPRLAIEWNERTARRRIEPGAAIGSDRRPITGEGSGSPGLYRGRRWEVYGPRWADGLRDGRGGRNRAGDRTAL